MRRMFSEKQLKEMTIQNVNEGIESGEIEVGGDLFTKGHSVDFSTPTGMAFSLVAINSDGTYRILEDADGYVGNDVVAIAFADNSIPSNLPYNGTLNRMVKCIFTQYFAFDSGYVSGEVYLLLEDGCNSFTA